MYSSTLDNVRRGSCTGFFRVSTRPAAQIRFIPSPVGCRRRLALPLQLGTPDKIRLQIMAPARGLGDRPGFALGVIEIAEAGISVGLEEPGVADEMPVRVLAVAVARVEGQRCGRVRAGERPIIPDNVDPQAWLADI